VLPGLTALGKRSEPCSDSTLAACSDIAITVSRRPPIARATSTAVVPLSRASPSRSTAATSAAIRTLASPPALTSPTDWAGEPVL
jgi:hypothetical protein